MGISTEAWGDWMPSTVPVGIVTSAVGYAFAAGIAYIILLSLYRISPFHPYAKYPGPLLAKFTQLRAFYYAAKGTIHLDMYDMHQKYGDFVRYAPNRIIVNTTAALKDIHAHGKNFRKAASYSSFIAQEDSHSTHSVIDPVDHRRKRRLISQGLGDVALRDSEPSIVETIDRFVGSLAKIDSASGEMFKDPATSEKWGPPKNMADSCNFLTFDAFSDLLLGETFGMLSSIKNRYVIRGVESSSSRAGMFLQMPSLLKIKADEILFPEMSVFRAGFFQTVINLSTARLALQEKRRDIFQLIKDAKDPETGGSLPINEVVSECTLLIVAGSDTSSTVLAALFFYLAKYPRVCTKLQEEIRTNFESYGEIRGGQALNRCQYLRACLDEAMRMNPPVGGSAWREAQKGGALVDGHTIPEGYDAGVATYTIHHKEEYYRKPFEFLPERWMVGDEFSSQDVATAKAAFNPFSLGPRGCPGKSLAYLELSIAMARVIYTYDFKFANLADGNQREFVLHDHFTSGKDGPKLVFKQRA